MYYTLHLLFGETADHKEGNWWKFEAVAATVDLAARLNKLSALIPASDSSTSDSVHIAEEYDM